MVQRKFRLNNLSFFNGIENNCQETFLTDCVISALQSYSSLSQSGLARVWRQNHLDITFCTWPKSMNFVYPLNDVWINMENNIDDYNDVAEVHRCWLDLNENLDEFRHTFTNIAYSMEKMEGIPTWTPIK